MTKHHRLFLCLSVSLLTSGAVYCQKPVAGDLVLAAAPLGVYAEFSPQVVCDLSGSCALFWRGNHAGPDTNLVDFLTAVITPDGQVVVQPKVLATEDFENGPIVAGLEHGFAVLWDQQFQNGLVTPFLQYYDESLVPQGEKLMLPFVGGLAQFHNPKSYAGLLDLLPISSGFAIYGIAIDNTSLLANAYMFFIDRNGNQSRPRQRLSAFPSNQSANPWPNGSAVQPNGDLVGVYSRGLHDVYVRRTDAKGSPLGPEQLVSTDRHASQGQAVVAVAPDGSFLVVWQAAPAPDTTSDILGRRFSAGGQPLGKPFRVNNVHQLAQRNPAITVDARGDYFIVWQSFVPPYDWDVKGRLFRGDGTPVADEIRLNQVRQSEQDIPHVTFSPSGTILVGWESGSLRQRGNEEFVPVARVFSGAPQ
jgi:hypothetical protein